MTENAVTTSTPPTTARPTWGETLRAYLEPASLRMFALGFSAGLPLLLVLGTLSFRLREAGLDRATIGYLSWVGLAYGFKWVWSPLVDRLPIPLLTHWLGRRRSWLLVSQGAIMVLEAATEAGDDVLAGRVVALAGRHFQRAGIERRIGDAAHRHTHGEAGEVMAVEGEEIGHRNSSDVLQSDGAPFISRGQIKACQIKGLRWVAVVGATGIEPVATAMSRQCSTAELRAHRRSCRHV